MVWLELFFSFYGRVGRLAFLLGTLAGTVVYGLMFWLTIRMSGLTLLHFLVFMPWWAHVITMVLSWPMLALTAKRYHDLDMSGWWVLLPFANLILSVFAAFVTGSVGHDGGLITLLIYTLGALGIALWTLWLTVKLLFFSGTAGTNRFGPPPRLAQHLFGDEGAPAFATPAAEPPTTTVTRLVKDTPRPRSGSAKPASFGKR